jgi:hypothetical protein
MCLSSRCLATDQLLPVFSYPVTVFSSMASRILHTPGMYSGVGLREGSSAGRPDGNFTIGVMNERNAGGIQWTNSMYTTGD